MKKRPDFYSWLRKRVDEYLTKFDTKEPQEEYI